MKIQLRGGNPLKYRGDVLVLNHCSDHRPLRGTIGSLDWLFNSALSRLWKWKDSLLDFGQVTLLSTQGKIPPSRVLLVGTGVESELSDDLRREAYRIALKAADGISTGSIALEGISIQGKWDMDVVEDLTRVLEEMTDPAVKQVDLYLPSPELLASARKVFPRTGKQPARQAGL